MKKGPFFFEGIKQAAAHVMGKFPGFYLIPVVRWLVA